MKGQARRWWKQFRIWADGGQVAIKTPWLSSLLMGRLGKRLAIGVVAASAKSVGCSWVMAYQVSKSTRSWSPKHTRISAAPSGDTRGESGLYWERVAHLPAGNGAWQSSL